MIRYGIWHDAWTDFAETARHLSAQPSVTRVCDIGGGANPALPLDGVSEYALSYDLLDVNADELAKAPPGYRTIHADALDPQTPQQHGPYDLVLSRFVAEHVRDPRRFHRNIRALLVPGGYAVHLFPTLYEPVFVANRLMPSRVSQPLLSHVQEGRETAGTHGKFDAYYRWCRGPSALELRRLRGMGFEVVTFSGYFGHGYFRRWARLHRLEQQVAAALSRHPIPWLTSYACVVLRAAGGQRLPGGLPREDPPPAAAPPGVS